MSNNGNGQAQRKQTSRTTAGDPERGPKFDGLQAMEQVPPATAAETAECLCPDFCERDHQYE